MRCVRTGVNHLNPCHDFAAACILTQLRLISPGQAPEFSLDAGWKNWYF